MSAKIISIIVILFLSSQLFGGGVVYLVIGSDTAIWNGMNTGQYANYYNIDLYVNPNRNAYKVMDPAFRSNLRDSYGNTLKMTWWMMAGNIFRYATNKNVPVPNIMTLYLMKKYHGDNVKINGDELTLHYHTFFWSDYDNDGIYWWNQAKTFLESKDDFNVTLSQFLLEENVFPVSFRSGWHYMDNDWQHYLDERILPYTLHNDYPAKRIYDDEPIDNIYDWSEAPSSWIPFQPSYSNYQKPGNGRGWNVRSASFYKAIVYDYLDSIFVAANNGNNQVACLWSHLPQTDFVDNIVVIDSLAHKMERKYPDVKFKYCTAVEAMQLWRESTDTTKPAIEIREITSGDKVAFEISSDEEIFQKQPFVAIKDIYENYTVADCRKIGENLWQTEDSFPLKTLVKVGVAVTDTMGNQTKKIVKYLPDDLYIDNLDPGYSEVSGNWGTMSENSWGTDSRVSHLAGSDSVIAKWNFTISQSTNYNIYFQVPEIENPVDTFQFSIIRNSVPIDTIKFTNAAKPFSWIYLGTKMFDESDNISVKIIAKGNQNLGKNVVADVIKITALVKDKELSVSESVLDLEEIVVDKKESIPFTISNNGISTLKLFAIYTTNNSLVSDFSYPIEIPGMSSIKLNLDFIFTSLGEINDTLIIASDDPSKLKYSVPINGVVDNYFEIIDNEDSTGYSEFGEWHTSVSTAHGTSSRFAYLHLNPLASYQFKTTFAKSGKYDVYELLPKTVNSTDNALYVFSIGNIVLDSLYENQNDGSGSWKYISSYFFPKDVEITLSVFDTDNNSVGSVLRADAIKFKLVEELTGMDEIMADDKHFLLEQNYPNPFKQTTTISFAFGKSSTVKIEIFNMLGEKVKTLKNEFLVPGYYELIWNGENQNGIPVASGIYFYKLSSGNFIDVKKMLLLR